MVYMSSIVAGDLGYNSIIPADAALNFVGGDSAQEAERRFDVLAEAVFNDVGPHDDQVTDTATVLKKLDKFKSNPAC
jgi:hypothetical protein